MKIFVTIWEIGGVVHEIKAYSSEEKAKKCINDWKSHYTPAQLDAYDDEYGFSDGYAEQANTYEIELDEEEFSDGGIGKSGI